MKFAKVGIERVAERAGVSPTAVSFAFNNPHRLNAQTVARIRAVADELGYTPNPHARALLAKSVGVLGILTPQSLPSIFANPFFTLFHEGVGQVCDEHDLSLLTISSVSASLSEASANAPVDGLIIVGLDEEHPEIDLIHRRKMPFVVVDGDTSIAPSINVDDEGGAHDAAAFLLAQGHRDIVFITFGTNNTAAHERKIFGVGERRLHGYQRAFAEHALSWSDDYLIMPAFTSATAGAAVFQQLWHEAARPTAIAAVADILAIGVLQAALQAEVQVPDELAIVGFDDVPQASWTTPAITTVHQPVVEKGRLAAQQLLALIAGETLREDKILLPTKLIIRQSA